MKPNLQRKKTWFNPEIAAVGLLRAATYLIVIFFCLIMGRIILRGAPVLAREGIHFLTEPPKSIIAFYDENQNYHRLSSKEFREYQTNHPNALILYKQRADFSGGGIFSPLAGTILLVLICIVTAMTVGTAAAIFLSEYGGSGRFIRLVRLAIVQLAGVPSVVFGLFGLAFFCYFFPVLTKNPPSDQSAFFTGMPNWMAEMLGADRLYLSFQGWSPSIISASCTLACMVLPLVIIVSEKSLRSVPQSFRDATLALGATRWQTIRKSVLPYALPGMLTASILIILQVASAVAPIMFTGAFFSGALPWVGLEEKVPFWRFAEFFQRGFEALPHHIYYLSAEVPQNELVRQMQDGAVFVFTMIIMTMAVSSVILRKRIESKMNWQQDLKV